MSATIRPLAPSDREQWEPLWRAYLEFYETSVPSDATETTWHRLLQDGEDPAGFCAVDPPAASLPFIVMPTSISLYAFPPSQNAVRPEIALREKGLRFESVAVDLFAGENKKPPLSEINPRGQVPTLVWDDGSGPIVIYESIATIRFIDDMVPEPPQSSLCSCTSRRSASTTRRAHPTSRPT